MVTYIPLGQSQINVQPAPAVVGDFASKNPFWTFDAGPGGLFAGLGGLTTGLFAWVTAPVDADGTPALANNFGTGNVAGFVHRTMNGLLTNYLQASGLLQPAGFEVEVMNGGDFWVVNNGSNVATWGMKAYATFANGQATFAASGAPTGGGSGSASTVTAQTFSVTGSISGDIMAVTAVASGTVYPGATISGTNVTTGNQVSYQLTPLLSGEAAGGVGRYYVSIPEQTTVSETISGTYGLLTIGGTVVTGIGVGNVISGTNVVAGTAITALGTGTGGAGTYVVNNNTGVSSTAISVSAVNVETKWYAVSNAAPGELVKISSHVTQYG